MLTPSYSWYSWLVGVSITNDGMNWNDCRVCWWRRWCSSCRSPIWRSSAKTSSNRRFRIWFWNIWTFCSAIHPASARSASPLRNSGWLIVSLIILDSYWVSADEGWGELMMSDVVAARKKGETWTYLIEIVEFRSIFKLYDINFEWLFYTLHWWLNRQSIRVLIWLTWSNWSKTVIVACWLKTMMELMINLPWLK